MPEDKPKATDYQSLITAIKECKPTDERVYHITDPIEEFEKAKKLSNQEWINVVIELIKIPHERLIGSATRIVDKYIQFKSVPNGIVEIVTQLQKKPDFSPFGGDEERRSKYRNCVDKYEKFADELDDYHKIVPGKKAGPLAHEILIKAWNDKGNKYDLYYSALGSGLEEISRIGFVQATPEKQQEYVEAMIKVYEKNLDGELFKETDRNLWSIQQDNTRKYDKIKCDAAHQKVIASLLKLLKVLGTVEENFTDDEGEKSELGWAYWGIISSLLLHNCSDGEAIEQLKDFIPICFEWKLRNKDDLETGAQDIHEAASMFVERATSTRPDLAGSDNLDKLIQQYLKTGNDESSEAATFYQMYQGDESARAPIDKYAKELVEHSVKNKDHAQMLMMLFWEMSKRNPAALESSIDKLEKHIDGDSNSMVAMTFIEIAKKNPMAFKGRGDSYLSRCNKQSTHYNVAISWYPLYTHIASINAQEAERATALMEANLKALKNDSTTAQTFLYYWTIIFQHHPEPIKKRKPYIQQFLKDATTKQSAQHLIDLIEGRSLKTISDDVKDVQEDVDDLDVRVTQNEDDIDDLDMRSREQRRDLDHARKDIDSNTDRVDDLEERVDVAEEDIIDLDNKTVSNAPAWSKDVSKLLNPEKSNDYRLIAQRLGYSPAEIRGWAQQPDPTMSMLAEFYTTNKTSEANHFLLGVLREVNRPDVARIIEKAQKDVENVVQDKPQKYRKPPPVFLSYQWGHQDHVKLLKHYLEKEGFACWMDIGQMGGGDSLYEEIDEGIRASKIAVMCMSEKYCKSPNCVREVNLSNGLGKRMIPLQMEKIPWPPPGSLGPIMAEKLFIRFYQRDNEKTNDERYWPPSMYDQLVDQIREKVEPDPDVIAEANGQKPPPKPAEQPVKPAQQAQAQKKSDPAGNTNDSTQHPVVFLSYQWKHQEEIKLLKHKLENDGISCWMDIGEMGGGDALYEAIDKGIRNCKAVVICVNSKYPKSDNCTKEVFLADGLKKKMIPILLEPLQWPPEGRQNGILGRMYPLPFFHGSKKGQTEPWPDQSYQALVRKIKEAGVSPTDSASSRRDPPPPREARDQSPPKRKDPSPPKRRESPPKRREPSPPKRQESPPRRDAPQRGRPSRRDGALSPIDRKRPYDVAISCSPDCTADMVKLALALRDQGYDTTVATYTEDSVLSLKTNIIICTLSARYSKSNMASNEVCQSVRMNRYMIPLVLDDAVPYPPEGQMRRPLSHIKAIDCTPVKAGSDWNGTPQLDKILGRLQNGPGKNPSSGKNRSKSTSAVDENPGNQRQRNGGKDSGYDSAEDRTYAKSMQRDNKLPHLNQRSSSDSRNRKTYGQGGQGRDSDSGGPKRREYSSANLTNQRRGYDADGPKLPSVYRQRFKAY